MMEAALAPGHECNGVVGATLTRAPSQAVPHSWQIRSGVPDPSVCPTSTPAFELLVVSYRFPRSVRRLAQADGTSE